MWVGPFFFSFFRHFLYFSFRRAFNHNKCSSLIAFLIMKEGIIIVHLYLCLSLSVSLLLPHINRQTTDGHYQGRTSHRKRELPSIEWLNGLNQSLDLLDKADFWIMLWIYFTILIHVHLGQLLLDFTLLADTEFVESPYNHIYGRLPLPTHYIPSTPRMYVGEWD